MLSEMYKKMILTSLWCRVKELSFVVILVHWLKNLADGFILIESMYLILFLIFSKYYNFDHPETNGQTEVINWCLEAHLQHFASEQPKRWPDWVTCVELWY